MLEREAELRVLERLVAQAAGGDGRVGAELGAPLLVDSSWDRVPAAADVLPVADPAATS